MSKFWSWLRAQEGDDGATLFLTDPIDSETSWFEDTVTHNEFRAELMMHRSENIRVVINSPGGDVFAGADIYTMLREHDGKVTTEISGIAASSAATGFMAGDERLASPVGYLMIHNPWTIAMGNSRELQEQAKVLDVLREGMIAAYMERFNGTREQLEELLDAETYMTAQQAMDYGFVTGLAAASKHPVADGSEARLVSAAHSLDRRRMCARIREGVAAQARVALDESEQRRRAEIKAEAERIAAASKL